MFVNHFQSTFITFPYVIANSMPSHLTFTYRTIINSMTLSFIVTCPHNYQKALLVENKAKIATTSITIGITTDSILPNELSVAFVLTAIGLSILQIALV